MNKLGAKRNLAMLITVLLAFLMLIMFVGLVPLVSANSGTTPVTIATSTSATNGKLPHSVTTNNGWTFVAVSNGTYANLYKTSSSGVPSFSFVQSLGGAVSGVVIGLNCNGTELYYARGNSSGGYANWGSVAALDGAITWQGTEKKVNTLDSTTMIGITYDTNNNVWVYGGTATCYAYEWTGASWTSRYSSGTPYAIYLTPLSSGNMAMVFCGSSTGALSMETWNGTAFSSAYTTTNTDYAYSGVTLTSIGNTAYVLASNSTPSTFFLNYTIGSGVWGTRTLMPVAYFGNAQLVSDYSSTLTIFYQTSTSAINATISTNLGTTWSTSTVLVSGESPAIASTGGISICSSIIANTVTLIWEQGTGSPYNLRYTAFSTLATVSVTFTSNPTGSGFITVNGSAQTSPYTIASANIGDVYTIAANSPVAGTTGIQYVYSSWNDSGAQSHSYTVSTAATIVASYTTQYSLTVTSSYGSPTGAGWYNSGASASFGVTTPSNVVAGQSQQLFSSWSSSDSGGYSGALASTSVTMNNAITETASWQLQYYLTVTGGYMAGGQGWVNAGSTTTAQTNWVWSVVSGQSRTVLTNWQLDTVNQNPTRSNTGEFNTPSITMSSYHTVNFVSTSQYFLTITGGNGVTYGTASPTSDNWYDSGTATTVSSNWVWNVVASQTQTGITNYAIDGVNQNPAQQFTVGTLTTPSVTMSTYHTIVFASNFESFFNVASSFGSPTGQGWKNNGASVSSTVSTPSSGYQTTGWTGTGSLASGGTLGSSTTGSFSITAYSTCVWNWVADPPTISGITTNSTVVGSKCAFNFTVSDPNGATLSTYIFGFNGVNDTATAFSSTPQTLSITKTLPTVSGSNVTFELWVNDTNNDWTNSSLQNLTTTVGSPSYLTVSATYTTIVSGLTQPYTALAYDKYNNYISDVSTSATWTISSGAAGSWSQNVYDAGNPSIAPYTVTASYQSASGTISLTILASNSFGSSDTFPSNQTDTGTTFKINAVQIGNVKNNQTGTVTLTCTFTGSAMTVQTVSVTGPFTLWNISYNIQRSQLLANSGNIVLSFTVPASATGLCTGTITVVAMDGFGHLLTSNAKISANVDGTNSSNAFTIWIRSHLFYVALIIVAIVVLLAVVAKFSRRRY